jgi:NADH dehydrogenase (ubiquinone) Fe-S protein 4
MLLCLSRHPALIISRIATTRSFSASAAATQRKFAGVVREQEEHKELPKELVSGAPPELVTERVVRIFQDSKPATQSGTHGTSVWRLDWDIQGQANRWENDLIGYQSSGDYM